MTFIGAKDLMLEIPAGNVGGKSSVNKFGRNPTLPNGTPADIWEGITDAWVAPTTARIHDIASDSASDDGAPVGIGARTIRVFGLTGWGTAAVSEDVVLNGVANVPTANAYVIVHRMEVLTKGASGPNVGIITATAQTDGTVTAQINAGEGQTQMAILGIPSTQVAYMTSYYASFEKSAGAAGAVDFNLLVNPEPDAELTGFLVKHTQATFSTGTSHFAQMFLPYFRIPGPAIIKISGTASAASIDASAGFDLILVDN